MVESGASRLERWAGPGSGVVGAGLLMAGAAMSDIAALGGVNPKASGATISRVIAENEDALAQGTSLLALGVFFLVWFFVYLKARLDPNGDLGWVSSVASISGVAVLILFALVGAYVRSLLQTSFSGVDEVIPKAVVVYDWDYWRTFAPFVSAHLIAVGVAISKGAARPRFIGWGAIAVAFLPLLLPPGLVGFVFMLWTLALSILLLANKPQASTVTPRT